MIDSFYIGAYWGSRVETIDEVVKKTEDTISELSKLDVQFSTWYELGWSKKKALERKISFNYDYIRALYQKSVKKGDVDGSGYTTHLFALWLWTGHKDGEASGINFSVGWGGKTDKMSNCIVLKLPYEGVARERLLQPDKAKLIMSIIIEIWSPDYAVLTSDTLRNKLNVGNNLGWITYRKLAKHANVGSIVTTSLNGGYLYTVPTSLWFDTDKAAQELSHLKSIT